MKWYILPLAQNDVGKRLDSICKKIFIDAAYHDYMQWVRNRILKIDNKKTTHKQKIEPDQHLFIAEPIVNRLSKNLRAQLIFMENKHIDVETLSKNNKAEIEHIDIYNYFSKDTIIFHNKELLALRKYAGEKIFPQSTKEKNSPCIANILHSIPSNGLSFSPAPCHRLDTGTSGVLLCALSTEGARLVQTLQVNHRIHKFYVALLESPVTNLYLTHQLYRNKLTKKTLALTQKISDVEEQSSNLTYLGEGELFLHSIEGVKIANSHTMLYPTIVYLSSGGGKTHQIRAQCLANNSPLFADTKYQRKSLTRSKSKQYSQAVSGFYLHASTYLFAHDSNISQEAKKNIPNAIRDELPDTWFTLIDKVNHDFLFRLDVSLDLFAKYWGNNNSSEISTDITALCISALGGVIG